MLNESHLTQIDERFDLVEAAAVMAVHESVRRSVIHPLDFSREVRHRTWQRLSSQLGFDYWRQAT